jgi:methylmalonyl-CoA mutase
MMKKNRIYANAVTFGRLNIPHYGHVELVQKMLEQAVIANENVFAVLMDAVRVCSLGQITNALFEVGGQYRRNM